MADPTEMADTIEMTVNGRARARDAASPTRRCSTCCATTSASQGPKFGCGLGAMRRLHRAPRRPAPSARARRRCRAARGREGHARSRASRARRHAARRAAGVHRRAGGAVRLLHQRLDHDRRGAARGQSAIASDDEIRRGLVGPQVPLRHAHEHPARGEARRGAHGGREQGMTPRDERVAARFPEERRRAGRSRSRCPVAPTRVAASALPAAARVAREDRSRALDSWLASRADGSVTASVGKIEAGMGVGTAFAQIVAEELDVPIERVTHRDGRHRDHASTSAAPARRTASSRAARRCARRRAEGARRCWRSPSRAPRRAGRGAARAATASCLVAGDAREARRATASSSAAGASTCRSPRSRTPRIRGLPRRRQADAAPRHSARRCAATYRYVADLRVPGMLHGRVIRPPRGRCAARRAWTSRAALPGLVRVVRKGDFLGVVCEREEQAIEAARKLEGRVVAARRRCSGPATTRSTSTCAPAQPKVTQERGRARRCRGGARRGGAARRGALRVSVPVARLDGAGVRGGRRARRRRGRLVRRPEAVSAARRARRAARPARRRRCASCGCRARAPTA